MQNLKKLRQEAYLLAKELDAGVSPNAITGAWMLREFIKATEDMERDAARWAYVEKHGKLQIGEDADVFLVMYCRGATDVELEGREGLRISLPHEVDARLREQS